MCSNLGNPSWLLSISVHRTGSCYISFNDCNVILRDLIQNYRKREYAIMDRDYRIRRKFITSFPGEEVGKKGTRDSYP